MLKINYSIIPVLMAALLTIAAGCGKPPVPEPPQMRSEVIIGLFTALEKKDHAEAVIYIEKLKALDPDNLFLSRMLEAEADTVYVRQAEQLLNANNLPKAAKVLESGTAKYPFHQPLNKSLEELKMLSTLENTITSLQTQVNSEMLLSGAVGIENIIQKYGPAKILAPLAAEYRKKALIMAARENRLATISLLCDWKTMSGDDQSLAETMKAELLYENSRAQFAKLLSMFDGE